MRDQEQQLLGAKGCVSSRKAGSEYKTIEKNINLQNFRKFRQKHVVGESVVENHRKFSLGLKLPPKCLLVTPGPTRPWKSTFSSKSHELFCEKHKN